jgi:hypothetical protein
VSNVSPALPEPVLAFLHAHVRSVLQLEALLLVFEAAGESLPAAEVATAMYLSEAVVAEWLAGFTSAGFCEQDSAGFRLTEDGETVKLLAEVAASYLRRPVTIGRVIFGAESAPDPRVSLAEAFRLRRDQQKDS